MKTAFKNLVLISLAALVTISLSACLHDESDDDADTHTDRAEFNLTLDAAQVVSGPITSGETGTATLTIHDDDAEISGSIKFAATAPNAVHIHSGFAGESGGIVVTLVKNSTDSTVWDIPDSESDNITLATLNAGGYYLNAHYNNNESSRAQIVVTPIQVRVAAFAAVTDVTTTATGFAAVTVNTETDDVKVYATIADVANLSSAITNAHLHIIAADYSTTLVALEDAASTAATTGSATWKTKSAGETLTPEQRADIAAGSWYVNVHTMDNPAGEIKAVFSAITNP